MKDVQEPIQKARPEIQRVITRILEAEKQKLYLERPHLVADVINIIKGEVK